VLQIKFEVCLNEIQI